ncbi:IS66 family insertion sequence element accessory protein TnpA [Flavitalea flava]
MHHEEKQEKVAWKFRGKAAIFRLFQEQVQSGQTIKSFCTAHGVAEGTFHNWKHKYGAGGETQSTTGFATLQIIPEPGLFAVVSGIKIYQPVSAAYLKELLSWAV